MTKPTEELDPGEQRRKEFAQMSGADLVGALSIADINAQSARDELNEANSADNDARFERRWIADAFDGREARVKGKVRREWDDLDPWGHPETRYQVYMLDETDVTLSYAYPGHEYRNREYIPETIPSMTVIFSIPNPDQQAARQHPEIVVIGELSDEPENGLVLVNLGEVPTQTNSDAA